jgi:hypothetical protein
MSERDEEGRFSKCLVSVTLGKGSASEKMAKALIIEGVLLLRG